MTQAQKSLYNLFLRVNKRSRDAGEPCIDAPQQAFTTLAEATMDTVAREIVAESRTEGAKGAEDQEKDFMPGQIAGLLSLYFNKNKEADEADPKGGLHAVAVWAILTTLKWTVINKNIKTTPPQKALVLVDKVSRYLHQTPLDTPTLYAYDKARPIGPKNPAISLTVTMDAHSKLIYGGKVSKFDEAVNDTISSIIDAGNTALTVEQVCRALQGKPSDYSPSKRLYDAVEKAIMKQRNIDVTADLEQVLKLKMGQKNYEKEAKERGIEPGITLYSGKMLNLDYGERIVNGAKTKKVYLVKYNRDGTPEMPIRYRIAAAQGQVASLPAAAFNGPLSGTERNILLTRYLVRELWRIRGEYINQYEAKKRNAKTIPRVNNHMTYDAMYEASTPDDRTEKAGSPGSKKDDATARTERKRFRNDVKKVIDYWIERKMVDGLERYQEYSKGKKIVGVEIVFTMPTPGKSVHIPR